MLATTHSLLSEALSGAVVLPGDPGWDHARSGFNLLLDQHPAAIALPANADDVSVAVAYARAAGLRVAPQATAHNQGPLGGLEDTLLLNVSALQEVRVDPAAKRVRVGAGVKWDRVGPRLSAHGLAGLQGSSPDVGIAGYSLGGGMGWLARKYGLQCNAVTAFEVVTAAGDLVRTDAENHPDLFWALRGGGGNFGVVTAIEFEVHEVEDLYAGAMFFPFERSAEVLHAWNALLPTLPDELMSWASVMHFPPIPDVPAFARGRSYAVVMAAHLGSEAEGRALLRPLRDLGPERDTFASVPPVVLGDLAMDPLDPVPFHMTHELLDELPAETIDEVMAKIGPESGRGPTVTILQFRHMGGALARSEPGAGARATLPGEICAMALGVVMDEASDAAVRDALADFDMAVRPHRAGLYANFVEEPSDASAFFEPAVWERLRAVKALYDPADLFAGNHHVPPGRGLNGPPPRTKA
jgi:FAD/FMN-containing dehydrogenase